MNRIEKLHEMMLSSGPDSFLQHALALEYIKINDDEKARALFIELLNRESGYVGSYYHLGKLLERLDEGEKARITYIDGMAEAKKAGDQHSFNELQAALEELDDE